LKKWIIMISLVMVAVLLSVTIIRLTQEEITVVNTTVKEETNFNTVTYWAYTEDENGEFGWHHMYLINIGAQCQLVGTCPHCSEIHFAYSEYVTMECPNSPGMYIRFNSDGILEAVGAVE